MQKEKIITIFGSSKPKAGEEEYELARELGRLLAEAGFTICNGGYGGTMEATAKGAKEMGGETIGVTVKAYGLTPNEFIDKEIKTSNLFKRLEKLIELGFAYVVLKGGSGTLVELALCLELVLKGVINPRPIVLMGDFFAIIVDLIKSEMPKGLGVLDDFLIFANSSNDAVSEIKRRIL